MQVYKLFADLKSKKWGMRLYLAFCTLETPKLNWEQPTEFGYTSIS